MKQFLICICTVALSFLGNAQKAQSNMSNRAERKMIPQASKLDYSQLRKSESKIHKTTQNNLVEIYNVSQAKKAGVDCEQGDNENGFQEGFQIGYNDFLFADDFFVSPGNTLHVKQIELSVAAEEVGNAMSFTFYKDDNGKPGEQFGDPIFVPKNQMHWTATGSDLFIFYQILADVDLTFPEGHYWMQPTTMLEGGMPMNTYWEMTDVGTLGDFVQHATTGSGALNWTPKTGYNGVFKLHCEPVTPPVGECYFNIGIGVEPITRVIFGNLDHSSDPTIGGSPALEDFTAFSADVMQGISYTLAVEGNTDEGMTDGITAFIDWNQNGRLDDEGEIYEIGMLTNSTGTDGKQVVTTIDIPTTAAIGDTKMRIIKAYGGFPTDPCASYYFGQAEDYTVHVLASQPCSGTPEAGQAKVTPTTGIPASTYTVSATNYTVGTGLSYQWQSNTGGTTWVNAGTPTSFYKDYTATAPVTSGVNVQWRLEVTCTNSSTVSLSTVANFTTTTATCGLVTVDNGSNDGYGDLNQTEVANDFLVNVGQNFTLNQFKADLSLTTGATLTSANISIYEDSASGGPGTLVQTQSNVSPSNVTLIANVGALTISTYTFDLTPVLLPGDPNHNKTYWISIKINSNAAQSFWEVNYTKNTANDAYILDNGTWYNTLELFGNGGDGLMEIIGTCEPLLGVQDTQNAKFNFYPNPVHDQLFVSGQKKISSINVFNLVGQKVLALTKLSETEKSINVAQLTAGVYIVNVAFQDGTQKTFKVIKK